MKIITHPRVETNVIPDDRYCKVYFMNNITEVNFMEHPRQPLQLRKLNAYQYVDLQTGEIKEYNRTENRSQNYSSLRRTFANLARTINLNVKPDYYFMLTLTYRQRENLKDDLKPMRDTKRLYKDLEKIKKALRYRYKDIEFIDVREPQQSGSFHSHLICIFKEKGKKISKTVLQKIWPHGFSYVSYSDKYKDVDNLGLYFTAYFTDIPAPDKVPSYKRDRIQASDRHRKKY